MQQGQRAAQCLFTDIQLSGATMFLWLEPRHEEVVYSLEKLLQ